MAYWKVVIVIGTVDFLADSLRARSLMHPPPMPHHLVFPLESSPVVVAVNFGAEVFPVIVFSLRMPAACVAFKVFRPYELHIAGRARVLSFVWAGVYSLVLSLFLQISSISHGPINQE